MGSWESLGKSDIWHTPAYVFDAMGGVCFDIDVAAPRLGPRHVPCRRWFWRDALEKRWEGFVWMNAPFGGRNGLAPWLDRFIDHGNGIALVPDRTSAPWFQQAARRADVILFLSPRVKFEKDDGTLGKSPGCGTALLAIGEKGAEHLKTAATLGLAVLPLMTRGRNV